MQSLKDLTVWEKQHCTFNFVIVVGQIRKHQLFPLNTSKIKKIKEKEKKKKDML